MPRRFTLAEAQSLIPQVSRLMQNTVALKIEFSAADQAVRGYLERVTMMGGMQLNREQVRAARERRETTGAQLKAAIEELQGLGCVVKDLDIGLVDFPTLYRGVEVCLCWKLGEERIEFWHGMEEGFRGRKRINEEFLQNHRGDPPQ